MTNDFVHFLLPNQQPVKAALHIKHTVKSNAYSLSSNKVVEKLGSNLTLCICQLFY